MKVGVARSHTTACDVRRMYGKLKVCGLQQNVQGAIRVLLSPEPPVGSNAVRRHTVPRMWGWLAQPVAQQTAALTSLLEDDKRVDTPTRRSPMINVRRAVLAAIVGTLRQHLT